MMNTDHNQLDLLEWRASATIHIFPPARRVGLVRAVADHLAQGNDASFWRDVVERLAADLRQLGTLTENEIECRLLDFRDAVQNLLDMPGPDDDGTPQGVPTHGRDAVQAELNRGHLARNT